MSSLDNLKRDLVTACRVLANEHVIDAFGHISVRIPETDRFLIPPFVSAALVKESDLLTLDLSGKLVEGNGAPNREIVIHSECYQSRTDIGSVCHTHSPMVKVLPRSANRFGRSKILPRYSRRKRLSMHASA